MLTDSSVAQTSQPEKRPPRGLGYSPARIGAEVGLTARAITKQLGHSRRDTRGRVVAGRWKGAYQSATGYWVIPAETVAAVKASEGRTAAVVDLTTRMDAIEDRLRHLSDELTRLRATLLLIPERRPA